MKHYDIVWDDGYKCRIHINNLSALEELKSDGLSFDDYYDDGTGDEVWVREG